jgi:hypothetical protein
VHGLGPIPPLRLLTWFAGAIERLAPPALATEVVDVWRAATCLHLCPPGLSQAEEPVWPELLALRPMTPHRADDPALLRRIERLPHARSVFVTLGTVYSGNTAALAEARIDKIDPASGRVLASIPAPGHGRDSGLAWAEGSLWVGQYRERKIHRIDPATGAILRTIESDRFVTGVTWVDGELWHGTWEGDASDLRRVDPASGAVLERLEMPQGTGVSGLESDGAELFYCGGGPSGKVRAVRRPAKRG